MSSIIANASQYVGSQAFDDLCQEFVEQATYGSTGHYASAIDAWNNQQKNAVYGSKGIQPGDLVYFAPDQSNNGFGHAGIYTGNNQFISATSNGVEYNDVDNWQKSTGQKMLGYIPQGQSAQGLGQQLNRSASDILGGQTLQQKAQDAITKMNNHEIPWDDNARAQANNILNNNQPTANQQPTYNFNQEMDNFKQVWNATHQTPLANYL